MNRISPVILCQKWAVAGNGLKQANSCWMLLVLVPINTKKNRNTDGPCQLRFFGHALFQIITDLGKNTNSAPEGRRDFLNTPKCAQGTHLYKCYEATYTLKRLVSEKIAKNRFTVRDWPKIGFLRFSRKGSTSGHMLLHNSYINMAIMNILVYSRGL